MKKILSVSIFIIVLISTILIGTTYLKRTIYIIDENSCEFLFSCSPEEFVNESKNITWTNDYCVSAKVSDAKLILVLNKKQIKEWKDTYMADIDSTKSAGTSFSSDYKVMKIFTSPQTVNDDMIISSIATQSCCILQMLNGEDVNNIQLDLSIINKDSGKVVWQRLLVQGDEYEFAFNDLVWE